MTINESPQKKFTFIMCKDFLNGILHVVKKDEKITFLEQNEPKNAKIR